MKAVKPRFLFFGGGFINKELRINTQINFKEIRLIDQNGEQLGIYPVKEAQKLAEEKNLDLVEISSAANPPVCRLMDYGKYKYEQSKKEKESKHKRKTIELKEVKIRPKINEHDYQVKIKLIKRIIGEGDKVKVNLIFRGREIIYVSLGEKILERLIKEINEFVIIERRPKLEGKSMIMILTPKSESKISPKSPTT
ncbi:MAG: translation initiation factor IF-3 [Armatimonadetes bacterium]|nr:translation initiation factor IF-3 [Armatimonadota bacterium]